MRKLVALIAAFAVAAALFAGCSPGGSSGEETRAITVYYLRGQEDRLKEGLLKPVELDLGEDTDALHAALSAVTDVMLTMRPNCCLSANTGMSMGHARSHS